ncbi:hypothetical protein ACFWAD_29605, partial [Rhodococcus sp. NPDC059969]|uniref:hypothetical protein n=1 Tax=Rhodococcus sp. NPDC059969 TaxID=3347018 RepID=UPI003672D6F8
QIQQGRSVRDGGKAGQQDLDGRVVAVPVPGYLLGIRGRGMFGSTLPVLRRWWPWPAWPLVVDRRAGSA